jgi:toxin CptA
MQRSFPLRPSRYFLLFVVLAHALAALAALFAPMLKNVLLLLFSVLAVSMVYYVLRDAELKLKSSWVALRMEAGRAVLVNRAGEEVVGELLRSSVVMPHLVALNVEVVGQRRTCHVVLFSDSMDAESFRQLRVALKWNFSAVS